MLNVWTCVSIAFSVTLLASPADLDRPRVERTPVPNGGELVTVFQSSGDREFPIVSYLRDTLGDDDPANDRIRQVWILTHKRQSLVRHALAAIPFFYTRLPSTPPPPGRVPRPVLDLGKPYDSTVGGAAQQILQVIALDPLGTPFRATTRSYRLNRAQHRELRLIEAAAALATQASDSEIRAVRSRLLLSSRLLGGLVSDENLDLVHEKDRIRSEEMRGRNWELLRQQAERNHLVFEPLRIGDGPIAHALLSVPQNTEPPKQFHGRFLKISNPWTSPAFLKSHSEKSTVPVALYSLEHPKVPYLLADMRNSSAPRRREMTRRAIQDTTIGILGYSRFAHLEYFAATWLWDFISNRRGATNNRSWRLRSYAELRQKLSTDTNLDPTLRQDLIRRTSSLAINPLEDRLGIDAEIARVQHASLVQRAVDPKGLAILLERNRQNEAALISRSFHRRTTSEAIRLLSLGLYRSQAQTTSSMLEAIDRHRRIQTYTRSLEELLAAGPMTDVTGNLAEMLHTVRELGRLVGPADTAARELLLRVAAQTKDPAAKMDLLSSVPDATQPPAAGEVHPHAHHPKH
jgi:hypothetical protein